MCGTAGEAALPLSLSGAFPSPADYAALLHHDPAHTSQQVQLLMLPGCLITQDTCQQPKGLQEKPMDWVLDAGEVEH